jgi:hypothetical protein
MDEVKVDLHVLRALMLHKIGGEVDHVDVVTVDEGRTHEGAVELLEKLAELGGLNHVGHCTVLGPSAGARNDGLPLRGLGDKVDAQERGVAGCGPTCVGTASPVIVGVDHQL